LLKKFNIAAGCIINKCDLNKNVTKEVEKFLKEENIDHISSIPYSESFSKALIKGNTIIEENDKNLKNQLSESWKIIIDTLK
jgi:MinD superfamily P-loop ATPase